jgi:hypothetical protein
VQVLFCLCPTPCMSNGPCRPEALAAYCPVAVFKKYFAVFPEGCDTLLPQLNHHRGPNSAWYKLQNLGVRKLAERWKDVFPGTTLHSGKRSAQTALYVAGTDPVLRQQYGGWASSTTMSHYSVTAAGQQLQASAALLGGFTDRASMHAAKRARVEADTVALTALPAPGMVADTAAAVPGGAITTAAVAATAAAAPAAMSIATSAPTPVMHNVTAAAVSSAAAATVSSGEHRVAPMPVAAPTPVAAAFPVPVSTPTFATSHGGLLVGSAMNAAVADAFELHRLRADVDHLRTELGQMRAQCTMLQGQMMMMMTQLQSLVSGVHGMNAWPMPGRFT